MNKNLLQRSFLHVLGVVLYVFLVGIFMENGEKLFGEVDGPLAPVLFLSLFVLSAAVTGSLILGKPILLYIDGQKKDAIKLFFYTLSWLLLAVIILIAFNLK